MTYWIQGPPAGMPDPTSEKPNPLALGHPLLVPKYKCKMCGALSDLGLCYNHRCTQVENPGEEVPDVFCQNPEGGQGFQEKLPAGGGVGGYCIFISKCFKNCLKGYYIYPPLPRQEPNYSFLHLHLYLSSLAYHFQSVIVISFS
jgi:hypothetical protein